MTKTALICGISGQDGAYLAAHLLRGGGHRVVGTSRDAQVSTFSKLRALGILDDVRTTSMTLTDFRSVLQVLSVTKPDEIYNLAGQTAVGLSFEQPVETLESIALGALNLAEAVRFLGSDTRLYNACSSECFGETTREGADETTPFRPRSPYAVAKATSFWTIANYREAYGLYACSGILFNHESPLRPARFVTRKVVSTACRIHLGSQEKLVLGNVDVCRDWGWAPDYVEAMAAILQQPEAQDFVIATGKSHSLRGFASAVFAELGLRVEDHLVIDPALFRPSDIAYSVGNPRRARDVLGWSAPTGLDEIVRRMVRSELDAMRTAR